MRNIKILQYVVTSAFTDMLKVTWWRGVGLMALEEYRQLAALMYVCTPFCQKRRKEWPNAKITKGGASLE